MIQKIQPCVKYLLALRWAGAEGTEGNRCGGTRTRHFLREMMRGSFRGIKPVCALDLFHGLPPCVASRRDFIICFILSVTDLPLTRREAKTQKQAFKFSPLCPGGQILPVTERNSKNKIKKGSRLKSKSKKTAAAGTKERTRKYERDHQNE